MVVSRSVFRLLLSLTVMFGGRRGIGIAGLARLGDKMTFPREFMTMSISVASIHNSKLCRVYIYPVKLHFTNCKVVC